MTANDEADLRRRASRWRHRNGLRPFCEGLPVRLLDPDQAVFARHVWRRGRLRRQLMLVGLLGVVAAVLLLGGLRLTT